MTISNKPTFHRELDRLKKEFASKNGQDILQLLILEIAKLRSALQILDDRMHITESFIRIRDEQMENDTASLTDKVFPEKVTFDARGRQSGQNTFHSLEYTQEGLPYRWSGPGEYIQFSVMVNRDKQKVVVLNFVASKDLRNIESITCMIDGEPIELDNQTNGSHFKLTGEIPTRPRRGPTHIVFNIPYNSIAEPGADDRLIGIAFTKLEIF